MGSCRRAAGGEGGTLRTVSPNTHHGGGDGEEAQLDRQAGGVQGLQARGHGPPEVSPASEGGQAYTQSQEYGLQVPPEEVLLAFYLVLLHRKGGEGESMGLGIR